MKSMKTRRKQKKSIEHKNTHAASQVLPADGELENHKGEDQVWQMENNRAARGKSDNHAIPESSCSCDGPVPFCAVIEIRHTNGIPDGFQRTHLFTNVYRKDS